MATFVPDTDPTLRSLLAACQIADDPGQSMAVLADLLAERGDPRAPLVRSGMRFWELLYPSGVQGEHMAEFAELESQLPEEAGPLLEEWLGFRPRTNDASIEWSSPLLHVHISAYRHLSPANRKVIRSLVEAGWVWVLQFEFIDEAFGELLSLGAPIRELRFDENQALRDADLQVVAQVPHLRELDLRQTCISDAGLLHLRNIPSLRRAYLERAHVSNAGIAALRKAMPACEVRR